MKSLIVICTFNPNSDLLNKVLESCIKQSIASRIVIVDSAGTTNVAKLAAIEFRTEYKYCEKVGIAEARYLALKQQRSDELLIFVDDDNVLEANFVMFALENANNNLHWGVFGGRLVLPVDYKIPVLILPFLPYLAIKDLGPLPRENKASLYWNELEPPGAGLCIRYEVTSKFLDSISSSGSDFFQVGAIGNKQFRGEDSYIARQAHFLNLHWGYDPRMILTHRFDKSRLKVVYLVKLLVRYGVSDVRLNHALHIEPQYPYPWNTKLLCIGLIYHLRKGISGTPTALRLIGQFLASRKSKSI